MAVAVDGVVFASLGSSWVKNHQMSSWDEGIGPKQSPTGLSGVCGRDDDTISDSSWGSVLTLKAQGTWKSKGCYNMLFRGYLLRGDNVLQRNRCGLPSLKTRHMYASSLLYEVSKRITSFLKAYLSRYPPEVAMNSAGT